ncbi:b(0,+)-type amino acid transporter 1-like [Antedon mediterranea]|uniref:b(0,+)-type amino acid transporter 1-like n=1 Tax=Antedon mediterranea TaxID=105859 RepID=UPI003AF4597B
METEVRKRQNEGEKVEDEKQKETVSLERSIPLIGGISLIVGSMIGSGIFVSPKGVLMASGSVGASIIVWTVCGIISTCGALCYAELGTMIPKSGGEYAYLKHTYGNVWAYLFSWTAIFVLRTSSIALISLAFADYVAVPFFENCPAPALATKLLAAACVLTLMIINGYSARLATSIQIIFTAAKLFALFLIILIGLINMIKGNTEYLDPSVSFKGSETSPFAYGIAFYQGLWAYEGWNQLNFVTEELQRPERNLPLSIIIGIPMVTLLYVMTNLSYLTVISPDELIASSAVAFTFGERTLGWWAWIMPLSVIMSTFGAANGNCFSTSRIVFATARGGHMVKAMSMVHVKKITPIPALVFLTAIIMIMLIPSEFDTLVNYFSFSAWIWYGATATALIVLRVTEKDTERPVKVPIGVPIFVICCSVYFVFAPIIDNPALEYLYAALFILSGLLFYYPFVYRGYHPKIMKTVTKYVQLLLEVIPTTEEEKND